MTQYRANINRFVLRCSCTLVIEKLRRIIVSIRDFFFSLWSMYFSLSGRKKLNSGNAIVKKNPPRLLSLTGVPNTTPERDLLCAIAQSSN